MHIHYYFFIILFVQQSINEIILVQESNNFTQTEFLQLQEALTYVSNDSTKQNTSLYFTLSNDSYFIENSSIYLDKSLLMR